MGEHYTHPRASEWICVDEDAEAAGSASNQNGALLYFVEYDDGYADLPGHVDGRELTCSICSLP
ncbi:MAG: hypothetical protein ACI8PZ_007573 [Myxococcota bacterium]|jgi:hypothetical protein